MVDPALGSEDAKGKIDIRTGWEQQLGRLPFSVRAPCCSRARATTRSPASVAYIKGVSRLLVGTCTFVTVELFYPMVGFPNDGPHRLVTRHGQIDRLDARGPGVDGPPEQSQHAAHGFLVVVMIDGHLTGRLRVRAAGLRRNDRRLKVIDV